MKKRNTALAIFGIAVAALVLWWRWPRDAARRTPEVAHGSATATASAHRAPGAKPESRVRRLGAEERKRLGEQITRALQRAHTATTTPPEVSPSAAPAPQAAPTLTLENVATQVRDALLEAVPLLAECYEQHAPGGRTAAAMMTLASDPELGTVIDSEELTDGDGKPLDPNLGECLQSTIESLALPGLGQPGTLKLKYTFRFDE